MLTADAADKKNTFKVAFLTTASIFVMGFLNALALNTHDLGAMISAQSGNVVWFGLNAAGGYWGAFLENFMLFAGFIGGIVLALFLSNKFAKGSAQAIFNWVLFIIPIIAYPLVLQYVVPPFISFFILAFACGMALRFFRNMYHLQVNNAMATGSVMFLGVSLKDKKSFDLFLFFVLVLAFAAGAFLYGILANIDVNLGADGIRLGIGESYMGRLSGMQGSYTGGRMAVVGREVYDNVSNLARMIGLGVICLIPLFFCPSKKAA
ncbi:MAG: DUF1275 domain-containing protein [Defluviitaleaceae bacterium]|nr:DUF1275 domain-containing protein [Defluviitaleaceae bacterium]